MFFCITFLCSFDSVSLSKLGEGDKKKEGGENKRKEEEVVGMGERLREREP